MMCKEIGELGGNEKGGTEQKPILGKKNEVQMKPQRQVS